jgi:2-polyprenyl-3-methyl-5-hydroxy-6-metoxy-1,4-benzoquinol methylase
MDHASAPAVHAADRVANRFAFGQNWRRFLQGLTEHKVLEAEQSLRDMLGVDDLRARRYIDVGSGSGLFSLAARRLGARVHSFDLDPDSVACTRELRQRYFPDDPDWTVEQASVLDAAYLYRLGTFDVVYSWGVLHHTGAMWQGMGHVMPLVAPGGLLFIAIYNDQGWRSAAWRAVKRAYNVTPGPLRFAVLWPALVRLWGPTLVRDCLHGRGLRSWREYGRSRGMSPMVDVVDWVGGYPFEVATPDEVIQFAARHGLTLRKARLSHPGLGCNEFVFARHDAP